MLAHVKKNENAKLSAVMFTKKDFFQKTKDMPSVSFLGKTPESDGILKRLYDISRFPCLSSNFSFFLRRICELLDCNRVNIISMDSFYKPLTDEQRAKVENYNFDHPSNEF